MLRINFAAEHLDFLQHDLGDQVLGKTQIPSSDSRKSKWGQPTFVNFSETIPYNSLQYLGNYRYRKHLNNFENIPIWLWLMSSLRIKGGVCDIFHLWLSSNHYIIVLTLPLVLTFVKFCTFTNIQSYVHFYYQTLSTNVTEFCNDLKHYRNFLRRLINTYELFFYSIYKCLITHQHI